MDKQIGIITFAGFHGRENVGSTMIRVRWLLDHWKEAEEFKIGQKYDVVIFQKVYWVEYAEKFEGIKILDLCDPDWLHWSYRIKQMIDNCDAVTCATIQLAKEVLKFAGNKPVWVIPDRVNPDNIKWYKKHKGDTKKVVWFGYHNNFNMLDSAIPVLCEKNLDLIIISDKPYTVSLSFRDKISITNYPWSDETWQKDLLSADVVLNPKSTSGKYRFKSDNKTLISWALGMPVAHTDKELKNLMKEEDRIAEVKKRESEIKDKHLIFDSIEEYRMLIKELINKKKSKDVRDNDKK